MKLKSLYLWLFLLTGILSQSVQAQNIVSNGTFDVNNPGQQSGFICNVAPFDWQASVSPAFAPLTGTQWEWRWHTSWWVDISDCGYGNGRWIKQDVPTTPGQSYVVGLDLLSNPWFTAGVDVYLDGVLEAHFDNINDGNTSANDWETFEFCWVASNSTTELKIVGNAPTGSSCPVIGLDNVYMIPGNSIDFEITLSNECVPAIVGYSTHTRGNSIWYYNGAFLDSNQSSIVATQPGTYTIEYYTACGLVTKDTTVVLCDTCKPTVDAREFCLGQTTLFDFQFNPDCIGIDCIGDFTVEFGDGSSSTLPAGSVLSFTHAYPAVGTYTVQYCWDNLCDGRRYCDTLSITIIDCDTCEPEVDIREFCEGQPTYFDFTFDPECFNPECLGRLTIHYGDGAVDVINAPGPYSSTHTYAAAGSYTVKYCWTDNCTGSTKCKTVKIIIKKCGCEPTADIFQFCLGQPTHFNFLFNKECEECISHMEVHTGDGTVLTGGAPFHFSYTYPAPGPYLVEYCWFDRCTGQRTCKQVVITIVNCEEPCLINPDFDFTICDPVQFTSTSVSNYPIVGYSWDFGDGTMGGGPNPSHSFPAVPGSYYVCLTIMVQKPNGEICEATICKWVDVQPCVPEDGGDVPTEPAPLKVEKAVNHSLALFPNPAQHKVSIRGILPEMKVNRVLLLGIDGKQLLEIAVEEGTSQVDIPLETLSKGTYLIRVVGESSPVNLKLIKE